MPKSLKFWFLLITLFLAGLVLPQLAGAVGVGPPKLEYRVDPGDAVSGRLFIINDASEKRDFYPVFEKFTVVAGEKKFMPGEKTALTDWFKMPAKVTINAGQKKDVAFTMEVPKNAPPGGHFAVIWWSSAPSGGQVSIITRAGILVYVQVSGDVRENGKLLSFDSIGGLPAGRHGWIFNHLPDFSVKFKNEGNTWLKPVGAIAVKNVLGATIATFNVNNVGQIILPQNEEDLRIASQFNKRPFAFGFYKAALTLNWGEKPETLTKNDYFLVLPWWLVLIIVIVLVGLYFGLTKGIKRYNQWIIKKYSANKHE